MKRFVSLSVFLVMLLASCEQPLLTEPEIDDDTHKVTLNIMGYTMMPFTSTAKADGSADSRAALSVVSHIDLAVFDADGNKVTKLNQKENDAEFGKPSLILADGTYALVVIAHSCSGVATISSAEEVTFPNNKVTDTFYACSKLVVSKATTSQNVTLTRPVAMVRVILADTSLPEKFAQLQLYYTGGSSTFNPSTGYGSKNSRQTELRTVADARRDAQGQPVFEIYTFPHDSEGTLKLTLTAQDANGTAIATEKVLETVPVAVNYITEANGNLFPVTSSSTTSAIAFSINDTWAGSHSLNF